MTRHRSQVYFWAAWRLEGDFTNRTHAIVGRKAIKSWVDGAMRSIGLSWLRGLECPLGR